jgi:hypothetical protein
VLAFLLAGRALLVCLGYVDHDDDCGRSTGAGGSRQRRPPEGLLRQAGPGGQVAQLLADRVAAGILEQDGDRVPDQRVTPYPDGVHRLRATQRPHRVLAASLAAAPAPARTPSSGGRERTERVPFGVLPLGDADRTVRVTRLQGQTYPAESDQGRSELAPQRVGLTELAEPAGQVSG